MQEKNTDARREEQRRRNKAHARNTMCGVGWARDRKSGAASPVVSFLILLCTFFFSSCSKCVGSTARRSGRRGYYCPVLESTCSLSAKRRLLLAEHYLPDQSSIGYGWRFAPVRRPSSPGARWKRTTPFSMSIHICISWKAAMGESRCTLIMRFVHGWIAFETNPFSLLECWSILIYLKGFQFPAHVEINLYPYRTWVVRLGFRVSAPNADICIRSVCKEAMQVRVPQLWQFHFVSACRFWSTAFRVKASNARYLGKICAKRQCRLRASQSWQFCFVSTCTFWSTAFSI